MADLLLVIDMQRGFVIEKTKHILPNVLRLVDRHVGPIMFTRFINKPDSGFVKWIHWSRFQEEPETLLCPELAEIAANNVLDKNGYTAFVPAFRAYLLDNEIDRIFICGVATDSCVLKTAADAFEEGIEPVVVKDACASHAGDEVHEAGLLLISRFVGRGQIRTTEEVVTSWRPGEAG